MFVFNVFNLECISVVVRSSCVMCNCAVCSFLAINVFVHPYLRLDTSSDATRLYQSD